MNTPQSLPNKITVLTEDFRNSSGYTETTNCPLAIAIKRQLDVYKVTVSMGNVTIKNEPNSRWGVYNVTYDWCSDQKVYGGEYEGMHIDEMIDLAQQDPNVEFPPLELELTESTW
jgi:hypothetical protein